MTRLVRLNEVQYAEIEDQVTALTAQGFREEALPDAPAPDPESAGDTKQEGTPDPEPDKPKGRGAKGGK